MKQIFLILGIALISVNASARRMTEHSIGFSVEAGPTAAVVYSSAVSNIPNIGCGAGLIYELSHNKLLVRTGAGFQLLRGGWKADVEAEEFEIKEYEGMVAHYDYSRYSETTQIMMVSAPLMAGMQYGCWYWLIGAKASYIPMQGAEKIKAVGTVWASDPDLIDDLYNKPNHGLTQLSATSKEVIDYKPLQVWGSAEFGWDLNYDERKKIRRRGVRPQLSQIVGCRLGFFVDYGLLSIRKPYLNDVATKTEMQGGLIVHPNIYKMEPYTLLGWGNTAGASLSTLSTGLRLTISFDLPGRPYPCNCVTDRKK